MFTKKAPPVRTTDPVLLKKKAIEFLNKNYNKYKYDPERSQKIPPTFYILSKLSNNYMIKNTVIPTPEDNIEEKDHEYIFIRQSFTDTTGKKIVTKTIKKLFKEYNKFVFFNNAPIWFKVSPFGTNASDVILGGKRKTKQKVSKRKTRRQ